MPNESQAQPSSVASSVASAAPASSVASTAAVSSVASAAPSSAQSSASVSAAASSVAYDLKLSAGQKFADQAVVERTTAKARALGLSNEAAQVLLDATVAEVDLQLVAQTEAMKPGGELWKQVQAQWKAASLADQDIGGTEEKLAKTVEMAQKPINRFATAETAKYFRDSGLGSHPEMIRFLAKIGAAMSESTLIQAPSTVRDESKKPPARRMYNDDGSPVQTQTG